MDYKDVNQFRQFWNQLEFFFSFFASSEVSTKLNSKITYTNIYNMSQAILFKKDTRNAYVIKASRAKFFITVLNHVVRDDGPIFRVMKEHIGICP